MLYRLRIAAALLALTGCATLAARAQVLPNDHATTGAAARQTALNPGGRNWVIAIGVDAYLRMDRQLWLSYASADARAVREFFVDSGFAESSNAFLLASDLTTPTLRPTRANLLNVFKYVAGRANADATVVVFYAGRGWSDPRDGAGYLVPEDVIGSVTADTCLPVRRVNELLAECPAARKVLLFDVTPGLDLSEGAPPLAETPAGKSVRPTGAGVGWIAIQGSRAGHHSVETSRLEHGVFAHCVIEALGGAAEADPYGAITASALYAYLARRLPETSLRYASTVRQDPAIWCEAIGAFPLATKKNEQGKDTE